MSDIHALSGAYAVDALDDAERAQFELHLAECATCRSEVLSMQEATALLAETTASQPRPELRERVLAGIATVRPLPPEVDKPPASGGSVTTLVPRRRRLAPFLAAAAAAIAIGTGGIVWQQVSDEPSRVEQIQAASDVERVTLPVGDGGEATVYRSKRLNEAVIVTRGMPSPPSGRQYVLWLQHGTTMTPAGVMPGGPDNTVVLSGDAATANAAAVSVEEAGTEPTEPSGVIAATFSFDA